MAKEKVQMSIDSTDLNEGKQEIELVIINGNRIEIPKGVDVEVSPIVKEIYNESQENKRKGNTQKKPLILE